MRNLRPLWIVSAFAALAIACFAPHDGAIGAPSPSPSPATTPALGYSGKGAIVVRSTLGGQTNLTLGGDVGFEQSGDLLRLDVLSVKMPGVDPSLGAAASTELFPPGGFTLVFDRPHQRAVIWSVARKRYFVFSFAPSPAASPTATPRPTPSPGATATGAGGPFAFFKNLKNYKTLTFEISLAGHAVTNGHPTTGLNFLFQSEDNDGKKIDMHGTLQSADDLDGLPVQLLVSSSGTQGPQGDARIDLTSVERRVVAAADFAVPKGFTKVDNPFDVVGTQLPGLPGK